jgi:hypothetical protein
MQYNGVEVKKLFEKGAVVELLYEAKRIGPLLIAAIIFLIPDPSDLMVAMYALGVVLLAAAVSQIVRRFIVPYLNLEKLVAKIEENSIACAIVVAATYWMFIQILQTIAVMFK